MKKMNFSRNFTSLRRLQNLTQESVAEKCGVSRQAITKWEGGSSLPDLYKLSDISEMFEVTVDELLYGEFADKQGLRINDDFAEQLEEILIKALKKVQNTEKPFDIDEEYRNYCSAEFEDDTPGDIYYQLGCSEAADGNMTDAISLLEEALARGEVRAGSTLINVYDEILDMCAFDDDESEYHKYELIRAQKMQKYGKIMESEIRRRAW